MGNVSESLEKRVLPNALLLGEVSSLVAEGKEVILMTKGQSMLPFIRGSRDSVALRRAEMVEQGDIVLAQIAPGHYVLHRVHSLDGDAVTLKGDGNLVGVEHCRRADIVGKVDRIVLPGGKERIPGKAGMWVRMPVLVRRVILGLYRRLIYNENK